MGNLATPFGSQPRPELDERHARSGNPLSPRPSRRCFGGHAPRAQLAGKSFAETIELNRTRIEEVAIQPLGLNRQMDMRARRSEERRGGKEGVSTFRSRWSPDH